MTVDITPENVAQMLEGVTDGPWKQDGRNSHRINQGSGDGAKIAQASVFADWQPPAMKRRAYETCERNARFIAYAREAVPALAARLAELEALIPEVKP
jgi:hypothetical protein